MVRNKIKMFAQKKVTLPPGRHKVVILDEADRCATGHTAEFLFASHHQMFVLLLGLQEGWVPWCCNAQLAGHSADVSWGVHRAVLRARHGTLRRMHAILSGNDKRKR